MKTMKMKKIMNFWPKIGLCKKCLKIYTMADDNICSKCKEKENVKP